MSKALSKAAARRRAKKAAQSAGLPDLAPIPKAKKRGRARMDQIRGLAETQAPPPVLLARARRRKALPTDAEDLRKALRDARAPWNGCPAGMAMAAHVTGDRERHTLWDAIQHMRAVWAAYDRALSAPDRHAQSLRLLLPIEAMQADASSPAADPRTEVERYRAAIDNREILSGWLRHVEPRAAMVCISTVIDDTPCRDPAAMVRALHCVADGMAGRPMQYRDG